MYPPNKSFGETARQADSEEIRRSVPAGSPSRDPAAADSALAKPMSREALRDESSLVNVVAVADLSPATRQALLALARTMQNSALLARARPKAQPWLERD